MSLRPCKLLSWPQTSARCRSHGNTGLQTTTGSHTSQSPHWAAPSTCSPFTAQLRCHFLMSPPQPRSPLQGSFMPPSLHGLIPSHVTLSLTRASTGGQVPRAPSATPAGLTSQPHPGPSLLGFVGTSRTNSTGSLMALPNPDQDTPGGCVPSRRAGSLSPHSLWPLLVSRTCRAKFRPRDPFRNFGTTCLV